MITVNELTLRNFELTLWRVIEASDILEMKRVHTSALEVAGKMGLIMQGMGSLMQIKKCGLDEPEGAALHACASVG